LSSEEIRTTLTSLTETELTEMKIDVVPLTAQEMRREQEKALRVRARELGIEMRRPR
jgi:hypothetical protein